MAQCDKSLSAGFIPINTWQQRASTPFKPAQGHRLQVKTIVANVLWRNDQTISITIKYAPLSNRTGGNQKRSQQSMNVDHKSLETVFLIAIAICCQSTTKGNQKLCFYHLRSIFLDSINVFDCRLSVVFIEYRPTKYVAKTIRNKVY